MMATADPRHHDLPKKFSDEMPADRQREAAIAGRLG